MGEAAHDVRPVARLAAVAGVLAARHTRAGAGHQLGTGSRIETSDRHLVWVAAGPGIVMRFFDKLQYCRLYRGTLTTFYQKGE